MLTIDGENAKVLRRAMDVFVQVQNINEYEYNGTPAVTIAEDAYTSPLSRENEPLIQTRLMDLAGSGFLNDGKAVPFGTNVDNARYGIPLLDADEPGITVTVDYGDLDAIDTPINFVFGDKDGNLNAVEVEKSRYDRTVTYEWDKYDTGVPEGERIYYLGAFPGKLLYYTTSDIVKCSLNLSGVQATPDNPSLEASTIDVTAIVRTSTNPLDFGDGALITYTAGYPSDASKLRRFYLTGPMQTEGKCISFSGADSVYSAGDFEGKYLANGGVYYLASAIRDMINTFAVPQIPASALTEWNVDFYKHASPALIPSGSIRDIVADFVNRFNFGLFTASDELVEFYFDFVDAGMPEIRLNRTVPVHELWYAEVGAPKITRESPVQRVQANFYRVKPTGAAADTQTDEDAVPGVYTYEFTNPVVSVVAKIGNVAQAVTLLNPYSAKVEVDRVGTLEVTATPLNIVAPLGQAGGFNGFLYIDEERAGITIYPPDWYGADIFYSDAANTQYPDKWFRASCEGLAKTPTVWREYEYRGDPRIQPRDKLTLYPEHGPGDDYIIESIALEHSGGGLTSTLTVKLEREGGGYIPINQLTPGGGVINI